jgi:Heparinase II/III-like protein/Heparinase II/III N-terminus
VSTNLEQQPVSVERFRDQQRAHAPRPYDAVMPDDDPAGADEIMERGWRLSRFPAVELRPPIAWDEVSAANRSWHYHLHCWDGLGPVLARHDQTKEERYLDFALAVARDWVGSYPTLETDSPFAWYDMAIALRAYRLGYILDLAGRRPAYDDDAVGPLLESVLLHRDVLADDDRFAAHSNHGFYQALGQLALALRFPYLPGMDNAEEQASTRLRQLVKSQFTEEGVHREHSPGYHLLVGDAFERALQTGLSDDEWLFSRRAPIHDALAWFVLPNGNLAMFGDTEAQFEPTTTYPDSPSLRFVISRGREGAAPGDRVGAFAESGYVVFRDRWPEGPDDFEDCSYLAQICAFHSRAHKHADDLSFVWYDRGRELLTDSGRFGYIGKTRPRSQLWRQGFWYDDPRRVYVESTRAHNTVEIDDRSYQRRDVKPYGSALVGWGEEEGVGFFSEAQVRHRRFITHRRLLFFVPRQLVLVVDLLNDSRRRRHRFVQRFHFAPELTVEDGAQPPALALPDSDERLHVTTLLPATLLQPAAGQEEPELLGWVSREANSLLPAWTVAYTGEGASHAFATLLRLSKSSPEPDLECSHVEPRGQEGQLRWSEDDRMHELSFWREPEDRLRMSYRVT